MFKSQLLKREWSEDMARNVRAHAMRHGCESLRKPWRKRAKARGENVGLNLRKLRKWPFGRPKAEKVTHPPRRP
eukprot:167298-Prymnesium_polylepis.2